MAFFLAGEMVGLGHESPWGNHMPTNQRGMHNVCEWNAYNDK